MDKEKKFDGYGRELAPNGRVAKFAYLPPGGYLRAVSADNERLREEARKAAREKAPDASAGSAMDRLSRMLGNDGDSNAAGPKDCDGPGY